MGRAISGSRLGQSRDLVSHSKLRVPFSHQIRASRLEQIDKELLSAQDRVQQTEPQVLGGAESGPSGEVMAPGKGVP